MSPRVSRLLQIALLVLAAVAATYPVLDNRFINWDDHDQITQNPDFNPPRLARMLDYWRGPYVGSLYPISYNFFGLLAWIASDPPPHIDEPLDPRVFHAASIALHALATLLIWGIVRLIVEHDWSATAGALLFAVHPVQVEPVAWVSGMNTLLVAVLSFFAIWQYLLAKRYAVHLASTLLLLTSATVAFLLGLWAKPAAVTVPIMAMLLAWLLTSRSLRKIVLVVPLLWLLLAIPIVLITRNLQTVELVTPTPIWSRPIVALDAIAFYLYKLLFPAQLLVDYGRTPQWLIDRPHVWASGLVTIAVAIACRLAWRRWPWLAVSFAVFVAALLPVLGLTPFNVQMISTVTDRYLYLAMLGPALAVAYALRYANVRMLHIAVAVLLIVLTVRSNLRARDWHDEFTLFQPELRLNPRSLAAHQVLGTTYAQMAWQQNSSEFYERALHHFGQALAVKPDDPRSLTNLGNVFLRTGHYQQAIDCYVTSLQRLPHNGIAMNNLGIAHENLGDLQAAEKWYRAAIERNPDWDDPEKNLSRLMQKRQGRSSQ